MPRAENRQTGSRLPFECPPWGFTTNTAVCYIQKMIFLEVWTSNLVDK